MSLLVPAMYAISHLRSIYETTLTEVDMETLCDTLDDLRDKRKDLEEHTTILDELIPVCESWIFESPQELFTCIHEFCEKTEMAVSQFLELYTTFIGDAKDDPVTRIDESFVQIFKIRMNHAIRSFPYMKRKLAVVSRDVEILEEIVTMIHHDETREYFIENLKNNFGIDISPMVDP